VLLNQLGAGRFKAYSAGSHPKGEVHPLTLDVLAADGLPTAGLRSKSWEEFAGSGAPQMDFVFTVCDDAAAEPCPVWPGHPITAHWGLEDPAAVSGTPVERRAAFVRALRYMRNRIAAFASLSIGGLDSLALRSRVIAIGDMEGSTVRAPMVA
jgi:arsenate reductase